MEAGEHTDPRRLLNRITLLTKRLADQNRLIKKIRYDRSFAEAIIQTIREPLVVLNSDFRIIYANRSFYRFFQVTQEETEKQFLKDIGHYQWNLDDLYELLSEIMVKGGAFENYELDCDFPRIGKRTVLLNGRKIVDSSSKDSLVLLAFEDITDQKLTLEKIRESEEKFRTFFENAHEIIFMTDEDDKIYEFNQAGLDLFGYTKRQIYALNLSHLFVHLSEFNALKKQISRKGFVKEFPTRLCTKVGDELDCLLTATRRIGSTGEYLGIQGIIRDITEQVKLEKKLRSALKEAQKASEVKSLFLANMSHEIRTPLNGILGFVDLLEKNLGKYAGEEEKRFFKYIHKSGIRLMRTIHEILDMSQIEAGAYDMKPIRLNLIKLVEEVLSEFQVRVEEKGLELKFLHEVSELFVVADQYSLFQAISHLVDNAIMFTPKGNVTIRVFSEDHEAILQIADTGVGMTEDYLENLFDLFSQESSGYNKKFQGIGLGLALVKRYLDMNEIPIEVESKKGEGTVFTLTLKAAPKESQVKEDKQKVKDLSKKTDSTSAPRVESEKPTVLVVEDDVNSQKLMGYFLRDKFQILCASSVPEAKEQLANNPVDLVLLDLSLFGDEDGLDLARFMRNAEEWKDIPIIALTAHAFVTDRENCLKAGCNDYLAKPVNRKHLLEKISAFIPNSPSA